MKSLVQELLLAWPMRVNNHRPYLPPMSFAVSLIRVGIRVSPNNYTEFCSCSFFFESFQKIPQSDDARRKGYKIITKQRIQKGQVIWVITQALWVNDQHWLQFCDVYYKVQFSQRMAQFFFYQASVVQNMDKAIDCINHYPVDRY